METAQGSGRSIAAESQEPGRALSLVRALAQAPIATAQASVPPVPAAR
jgi:hypothetical protein